MQTNNIYEEKISSKWITGILAVTTAGFLFILVYQILIGPIGTRPAPNWFFLAMFLLFLGLIVNFSKLNIKMTPRYITVRYGIFKHKILWENVEDCYLDEASAIRYGGWGIRIGRVKGKWRLVYNVIGGPRVVLSLNKGKCKEFVFSTNNPQKAIETVKQKLGETK
ncbi:MAG: hypothetical protein AAGB97_09125 [Dehalococcoidia bacterium]